MNQRILENFLKKIKIFLKKYHLSMMLVVLLLLVLYKQFSNIKFIYKSNILTLQLVIPLIIIFILVWIHSGLDKSHLLTSASIIFAVFVYLLSFAYSDDSKIKLISGVNNYNCMVLQDILNLKERKNLSEGFSLRYFVLQPYLDNENFILEKLGTATGADLLNSAYVAQGANSLINQVQSLNVQGSNPLFGQFVARPLEMYNKQLIEIASSTSSFFCNQLFR